MDKEYDLLRKPGKDGGVITVTLRDTQPATVAITLANDVGDHFSLVLNEEDALELGAVLTQSL